MFDYLCLICRNQSPIFDFYVLNDRWIFAAAFYIVEDLVSPQMGFILLSSFAIVSINRKMSFREDEADTWSQTQMLV